jgi:hypothetical protein
MKIPTLPTIVSFNKKRIFSIDRSRIESIIALKMMMIAVNLFVIDRHQSNVMPISDMF